MTSSSMSEKTMADYRQSLIYALRMKDVPGDRIGVIVAELEAHVAWLRSRCGAQWLAGFWRRVLLPNLPAKGPLVSPDGF